MLFPVKVELFILFLHFSRSESGAGSTTGLDDAYLDMDFTRKINLSNDGEVLFSFSS
jgi:hypothetical protein